MSSEFRFSLMLFLFYILPICYILLRIADLPSIKDNNSRLVLQGLDVFIKIVYIPFWVPFWLIGVISQKIKKTIFKDEFK